MKDIVKKNIARGWMQRNCWKYYNAEFGQVSINQMVDDAMVFVEAETDLDEYRKWAKDIAEKYEIMRDRSIAR